MPADASIYNQQQPAKFNTPFEFLPQMLQLKQQQEVNRSIVQQRETATAAARQKSEEAAREAAAAQQVRALFNRLDPATQQPVIPQMEELAGVIGPEKAVDIFKGFEALRTARSGNAAKDTERIAQVLGGVESMPSDLRAQAYDGALAQLVADGTLKPGQAPAKYDAGFVKAKRREALSVVQQFEQDKKPAPLHVGNQLVDPTTMQPVYTAPEAAPKVGTLEEHLESVATARGLKNARQLDPRTKLQEKARFEAAGRAPEKPDKPSYEWAQTAEGTKLLTPQEIRAQGASKPIPSTDKGKYKNAEPVLAAIADLSEKINTGQGIIAKMGGGASKLAAKANYDDDVAEFQALVEGFTPLMARALGHTGVLTQQDVDSVKALFPQPGNSKSLRDRKIARVRDIFDKLEGQDADGGGPATPKSTAPPPPAGRVRVKGPNGETGTMPAGSALPPGWSKQ